MAQAQVIELSQLALSRRINRLAEITTTMKELEKEAKALKENFRQLGEGSYASADHSVVVRSSERVSLDQDMVRSILSPTQIAHCSKISVVTTITAK